jgi:tetratricopeptide (TPR) repeat protein
VNGVGEQIRRLRRQAGLSQQQLAGGELSRAFICMVERGKARPSPASLQLIAVRLGQPVSALLEVEATGADHDRVAMLLADAERLAAAQPDQAIQTLQEGCRLAVAQNMADEQFSLFERLGAVLRAQGRKDEALDSFERCLEVGRLLQVPRKVVQGYLHLADTMYGMHQFLVARRYYDWAFRETDERKSLMDLRQQALTSKANCFMRVGDWAQAAVIYEEAVALHPYLGDERTLADAYMGLGVAWRRLGRLSEAHAVTLKSLTLLQKLGDRNRVLVLQNLATIEGDQGLWSVALPKFDTCREAYRVFGWPAAEASLVEELALYARSVGDLPQAEAFCQEALALLERQDEPILRGRVLQLLGEARLGQGDARSGDELLQASRCILRYFGDGG